ncbi:MAG: IS1634 family transposase [Gammaproteobacteria bacterium]
MYVDISSLRRNGKTYTRYLLRECYREEGKVKHRTIANLSRCSPQEIEAVRLALRHKQELAALGTLKDAVQLHQGPSIGAVWLVYQVARHLGIEQALGPSRQGRLALWQVIARVIDPGSRLSAVRLATTHAACDVLGLERFDEEDLYGDLDWLAAHQSPIEDCLFQLQPKEPASGLFLYDVTSSYLEGNHNELGAFGYNRDGKRGKRQLVIGLLCNGEGRPLSIEVFAGNTQDPKTFTPQVKKVAKRFGGREITFVGDRGMIKTPQIEALGEQQFHYITAITKPQIEALLKSDVLQLDLFDETLAEITTAEGLRYILRRNPHRAEEIAASREDKYQTLNKAAVECNHYLSAHPRARVEVALRLLENRCQKLRLAQWVKLFIEGREIRVAKNPQALGEIAKLDGCYVLKTDLAREAARKETVHDRYKDLALVEWAFRESKTVHLEMRPIYVRRESRTRGHAFVVMLAYTLIKELATRWQPLDLTVKEGIDQLATLCLTERRIKDHTPYHQVPTPRDTLQRLLDAAQVRLPKVLPSRGVTVTTKTKLQNRRKQK